MKPEISEQILLKGLAANDNKIIEIIYKQNFATIQSFILNNNGTYDDARDIFQEAMIAMYEKAQTNSFVLTCKINTYIYSICRRLWLKRLQQIGKFSNSLEKIEETVLVDEDVALYYKRDNDFKIMEQALLGLGEPCRSLLEGFYIKKMDMQQLSEKFGYTNADNAKTQKYKCLIRLKKLFFTKYNIGE